MTVRNESSLVAPGSTRPTNLATSKALRTAVTIVFGRIWAIGVTITNISKVKGAPRASANPYKFLFKFGTHYFG